MKEVFSVIFSFLLNLFVYSQNIEGKSFSEYTHSEQEEYYRYAKNKGVNREDTLLNIYKGHFGLGYNFDDVVCALHFTGHKYVLISEISAVRNKSDFMILNIMVDGDIGDIINLKFQDRILIGYERKKEKF